MTMEYDAQIKLQAYLDGELPEGEAREVAKWLAQDQEAVLLHAELKNTRQALFNAEKPMPLPETREFFWSKIEREISRSERAEPVREKESFLASWRRFLVPVSAAAVLAIVILNVLGPGSASSIAENEVESDDSGGFVYRDHAAQATLVWLSYPAENEVANAEPANKL
jgi:anti-sigma factor RsiW